MVVRETQRAFMYFCLYGLVVDAIVVNRLFPATLEDGYFSEWLSTQQKSMEQIHRIFDPIPLKTVNILRDEVVGADRLLEMGEMIYGDSDPAAILHSDPPYRIEENGGDHVLEIKLPFISKEYIDLYNEDGDLVVRIGSFKRRVMLPRMLAGRKTSGASLNDNTLSITFPKTG
jgi:arsenite-transporting ATPase